MSWVSALQVQPQKIKSPLTVVDPPGYQTIAKQGGKKPNATTDAAAAAAVATSEDRQVLQVKKAWEQAIAPLKSLPMSAIMTWFSGSSIQIFSVMMTGSLFWTPVKVLASDPFAVFAHLDTRDTHERLMMPKVVFVVGQVLSIVLGIVKLQYMGLLPTTTSDWLAWESCQPSNLRVLFE